MKPLVIYHSADFDGIFCREIARMFLPDAELVGWNFGDAKIYLTKDQPTYVLDLPPDCLELGECREVPNTVIWIDHHKSSIEKWPAIIAGYRIDGVAACRLAWQWFWHELHAGDAGDTGLLPDKDDFVERRVVEPLAVRLAGEYDIWDKRDPIVDTFQYGLRVDDLTDQTWYHLLEGQNKGLAESLVGVLLKQGRAAQKYAQKTDADLVKHRSYRLNWEGLNFIVLNTGKFNSLTFAALDVPETGHDALLGYMFNGKCWTVSLYHAKHRTDLDLSLIAAKYGGGGHRGACGFTCSKLPFMP
jgi:uncharacterized protein